MTNTDKILEEVLKIAVDRFLGWKLPKDFQPDGGISFKSGVCETIGTHLFTAQQANEMLKYVLEEALTTKITQAIAEEREKYTKDINFLKKLHSIELDALSLKSLEDFMKWSDDRRHTPVSPSLSSLDKPLTDKNI